MTRSKSIFCRIPARSVALGASLAALLSLGACSGEGTPGLFTTGSLTEPQVAAAPVKPAVDPACVTLAAHIDQLKQDAAVANLEKAADGKTPAVSIKRTSLQTQTQLNKANADFIAKCGPRLPKTASASPAPVAAAAPAAAAPAAAPATVKAAAKATAPAPTTGVTTSN